MKRAGIGLRPERGQERYWSRSPDAVRAFGQRLGSERRRRPPALTTVGEPTQSAAGRRFATYANDAVLPFYVLHETVVVVVAYHVLARPIGAGSQFLLISLTSLAATLLVYDLAVRRSPATRFLFGLKPDRRTPHGMPARRERHHANADAEPGGG